MTSRLPVPIILSLEVEIFPKFLKISAPAPFLLCKLLYERPITLNAGAFGLRQQQRPILTFPSSQLIMAIRRPRSSQRDRVGSSWSRYI